MGAVLFLKNFSVCPRLWIWLWTMLESKDLNFLFNLLIDNFENFLENAFYIQAVCYSSSSLWVFHFGTNSKINSVFFSFCRWQSQNRLTTWRRKLPGMLQMCYYKSRKTAFRLLHFIIIYVTLIGLGLSKSRQKTKTNI